MFKPFSVSIVGGLAVLLLVTGCSAPAADAESGSKPTPTETLSSLEADAEQLLADVGVTSKRSGIASLAGAPMKRGSEMSDQFQSQAREILSDWYVGSNLERDVLNAPDLDTATALAYAGIDLAPDLGTKLVAKVPNATEFAVRASWMGDTPLLGEVIPTYAEFESWWYENDEGTAVDVMRLRASTIYAVEMSDGKAGLIVATREMQVWAPAETDISSNYDFSSRVQISGADDCVYKNEHVLRPDNDPATQKETIADARKAVSGERQTDEGWDGFVNNADGLCT